MLQDHIFFSERCGDEIIASFEGSILMDETGFTVRRSDMLLRGLVGQSASNKNADGEEYKQYPLTEIAGTHMIKKRFGRKVMVFEMNDGTELHVTFWHGYESIPYVEELLASRPSDKQEQDTQNE